MMRQFNGNADDKDYYYKDYLGQLCFFDGEEDWIIDVNTGERRVADWFWYLEK
jgi:hypothetical protein